MSFMYKYVTACMQKHSNISDICTMQQTKNLKFAKPILSINQLIIIFLYSMNHGKFTTYLELDE